MHGIESEPVEMEIGDPTDCALDEEPAYVIAPGARHVHRIAPRRAVGVGEVRTEAPQHVALGPHVVVHDIEHHSETHGVRRVDESGQSLGSAVRLLHGGWEHSVVAPVANAGERCHGHDLDGRDPQRDQSVELGDRRVERSLGGERADVHLVEHGVGQVDAGPVVVSPAQRCFVDHCRCAADSVGLPPRCGIRQFDTVDDEPVALAVADPLDRGRSSTRRR